MADESIWKNMQRGTAQQKDVFWDYITPTPEAQASPPPPAAPVDPLEMSADYEDYKNIWGSIYDAKVVSDEDVDRLKNTQAKNPGFYQRMRAEKTIEKREEVDERKEQQIAAEMQGQAPSMPQE